MSSYFIFAGEISGDLHGSRLIHALKEKDHSCSLSGVGGPRMRQEGINCIFQMEDFQVMGFSDVVKSLPRLWKLFYRVRNAILKLQPDCVILIDYPGFNLRLARALRKQGYTGKLVQYVCPSVWAHGKKRIKILESCYDLLLTILPFEDNYFDKTQLKVEYVGNPLVETINTHRYKEDWHSHVGLSKDWSVIALFPGSRPGEIEKHIPQQLHVATQLKQKYPHVRFALSCAHENLRPTILSLVQQGSLLLNKDIYLVPPNYHYDLMRDCKFALAKSGTVTLELALHQVPTVVHYELSLLNYFFAKYVLRLRLPYYCIVNILCNQMVFHESIGCKIDLNELYRNLEEIHLNPLHDEKIKSACGKLKTQLSDKPAHQSAAKTILELLS